MKDEPHDSATSKRRASDVPRGRAVIVPVFLAGLLFLLVVATVWFASGVLLLVFASVLVAILLYDAAALLRRVVPLSKQLALVVVVVAVLAVLAGCGWLLAPNVSGQIQQLATALPASVEHLVVWLQQFPAIERVMSTLPRPGSLLDNTSVLLARAQLVFGNVLGSITNAAVVIFVGLYLAAQPQAYVGGFLRLVPAAHRDRAGEVLGSIGDTLKHWLRGKLLTMFAVGVLTAGGLALIGLPLALTLGIIAGLLDFIPYIGPIIAGLPAGLIAFAIDPFLMLWVALLFLVVQSIEGYLLLPLIERNTVSLPPALTITVQVLMGLAFGLAGVALATPFAATVAVAVRLLYVEDLLGEK